MNNMHSVLTCTFACLLETKEKLKAEKKSLTLVNAELVDNPGLFRQLKCNLEQGHFQLQLQANFQSCHRNEMESSLLWREECQ